jgi:hypothetical protein
VQRRNDRYAPVLRQPGEIERQVEQTVNVNDVGLTGAKDVVDAIADDRRPVRVGERAARPIVDDFDDRETVMDPPRHFSMRATRIELSAKQPHLMTGGQRAAQLEGVDLRACPVARQEVMDDVEEAQKSIITWPDRVR